MINMSGIVFRQIRSLFFVYKLALCYVFVEMTELDILLVFLLFVFNLNNLFNEVINHISFSYTPEQYYYYF